MDKSIIDEKGSSIPAESQASPFAVPEGVSGADICNFSKTSERLFDADELRLTNVIGNKIAEERKKAGMNQQQLSDELKRYNIFITAAAISKWEKGDSSPNAYQLIALSLIFGITDVIPTFTGLKPVAAEYTPELNLRGRNILETIKKALIDSGDYKPITRKKSEAPEKMIELREYDQPAAAGTGCYTDEATYSICSFPESTVPEGTDFVIRVSGDSMLPRYVNGQPLMIEQCRELDDGDIGVFMYEGNSYVKQYTEQEPDEDELDEFTSSEGYIHPKVVLHSLNPDYDDIEIRSERFYIVGRVLN